jgi:hypothetical protein
VQIHQKSSGNSQNYVEKTTEPGLLSRYLFSVDLAHSPAAKSLLAAADKIFAANLDPSPLRRYNMQTTSEIRFSHRQNRDGTFDSICPRCYRTIANRTSEAYLAKDELRHVCLDWDLDDGYRSINLLARPVH